MNCRDVIYYVSTGFYGLTDRYST